MITKLCPLPGSARNVYSNIPKPELEHGTVREHHSVLVFSLRILLNALTKNTSTLKK